jgi:hypothetical protein
VLDPKASLTAPAALRVILATVLGLNGLEDSRERDATLLLDVLNYELSTDSWIHLDETAQQRFSPSDTKASFPVVPPQCSYSSWTDVYG